jgi:ATP-binding protein involved in chromosome partitioning
MPLVGVIENMSFFTCDHGTEYALFGEGGGDELASSLSLPLLARVPLDPAVVAGGDEGAPVTRHRPESPAALAFHAAALHLVKLLPPVDAENCTGRIAKLLEQLAASGQDDPAEATG